MKRNPFLGLLWATFIGAAIISNTVDDTLTTLWGMTSWAPWLVSLGLVLGWRHHD